MVYINLVSIQYMITLGCMVAAVLKEADVKILKRSLIRGWWQISH